MTDDNDLFKRVEAENPTESEHAASIFRAAVEGGDLSDINETVEHLELLRDKREQAVELGMSGAKKKLDARLEQAEKDLSHLVETADDRREEQRAKTLQGLASGANADVESLADEPDAPEPSSSGTAQLSAGGPQERQAKISRLSESATEAENLGYEKAAERYRDKISMLRKER